MQTIYPELIVSLGTGWFAHTLPGVLQKVLRYDHFLLALYEKDRPLAIVHSDFGDVEIRRSLDHLVGETYVAEPIYRLFQAREIREGVHEMSRLTELSRALPDPVDLSSPHLVVDRSEEIGWRTKGWPEHQRETCVLISLGIDRLIAISLYNLGVHESPLGSTTPLVSSFPVLAAIVRRHDQLNPFWSLSAQADPSRDTRTRDTRRVSEAVAIGKAARLDPEEVITFFADALDVELTRREADVFAPLLEGETLTAVARTLCISIYTARTHRRNVYRKIGHGRMLTLINQFHEYQLNSLRRKLPEHGTMRF